MSLEASARSPSPVKTSPARAGRSKRGARGPPSLRGCPKPDLGEGRELARSDVRHSYLWAYFGSEAGFYDEEIEEMRR